jgi:cysteine-rich repeat protein
MFRKLPAFVVVSFLFCAGCSGRDRPVAEADSGIAGTGGGQSQAGGGGQGGESGGGETGAVCNNGVVEGLEQCDDGNEDETDGCTPLCEFTCEVDSDCDRLEDVCSGSSMTCDTATHTCVPGPDRLTDGEQCGDNAWCYNGKCYPLECGNGIVQPSEQCDDGNTDDTDGCTKLCEFTCEPGEEGGNVNMCDPTASCDEATHTWVAGDPLPDGTLCDRGKGYCVNGVCVYSVCGDGIQEPNEECDLGEQNGTGGDCTAQCTLGVCGNGTVEGLEQCDDGNTDNLDGCDFQCKVEVTFRGTRMDLSTEPAPDYCYYADPANNPNYDVDLGNAFKDLFPEDASGTSAILDLVNDSINGMMDDGSIQAYFYSMDVDDYSGTVPDPNANLGLAMGEPVDPWPAAGATTLDLPVYAYTRHFDQNLEPLVTTPGEGFMGTGEFTGEPVSVVRSTAPVNAGFDMGGTTYMLQKMMSRIEVDGVFGTPPGPPDNIVPTFTAPESVGSWVATAAERANVTPTGVLCGAFHEDSFNTIPIPVELLALCTGSTLRPCGSLAAAALGGQFLDPTLDECDSMLEMFKEGCNTLGLLPILNPIGEPGVDTDGDGVNDSYTCVLRVSAQRVKIVGTMEAPPE